MAILSQKKIIAAKIEQGIRVRACEAFARKRCESGEKTTLELAGHNGTVAEINVRDNHSLFVQKAFMSAAQVEQALRTYQDAENANAQVLKAAFLALQPGPGSGPA